MIGATPPVLVDRVLPCGDPAPHDRGDPPGACRPGPAVLSRGARSRPADAAARRAPVADAARRAPAASADPAAGSRTGPGKGPVRSGCSDGRRRGRDQGNYFCRSPRRRSAGRGSTREACDTARFPRGGRVGHGCAGSAIAGEADGRDHAGGGRSGGRDERAGGAQVAERGVAVDGEGAADVADAGGPVRRRVAVGGRSAAGGRHRRATAGADAVQGAVRPASGSLSACRRSR